MQSTIQTGPISDLYNNEDPGIDYLIFRVEAIQEYIDNPKYDVKYGDFEGLISVKKEFEGDNSLLSHPLLFSYAYKKNERDSRALLLFARHVMMLDIADQHRWFKYMLDRDNYKINGYFGNKYVFDKPVKQCSIFRAILLEIKTINDICVENGLEKMFENEYLDCREAISEFRVIFLPTKKNYYSFVMTTNKIVNESLRSFLSRVKKTHKPKSKCDPRKVVLFAFENYLIDELVIKDHYIVDNIILTLEDLYEERNISAHEVLTDELDESLWLKQDGLLDHLYGALREIRIAFAKRYNSKVLIPKCIQDGKNIMHP